MISKNGKAFYTEAELEMAKQNNNALQYALSRGYEIIREGTYARLAANKQIVFTPKGTYYDNGATTNKISGDAIDFAVNVEHLDYVSAVLSVAGISNHLSPAIKQEIDKIQSKERKPFRLPAHATDNKIITEYLTNVRGIDADVVRALIKQGQIYQSTKYNSLVMVGYDNNHVPKYASWRSTTDKKRADIAGSDKSYPFYLAGKTNTVVVCESPIEVMSYFCLCRATNSPLLTAHIVALGGATVHSSLDRYLAENKSIDTIVCGLNDDSDNGKGIDTGKNAYNKLCERYGDKYTIAKHSPYLNDWNDVLCDAKQRGLIKEQPHIQKERQQPHKSKGEVTR